jgi:hypothetical protein
LRTVADPGRIVNHPDRFGMPGSAGADNLVARGRLISTGTAGNDVLHTPETLNFSSLLTARGSNVTGRRKADL